MKLDKRSVTLVLVSVASLLSAALGVRIGRADGVPKTEPLYYAGTMEDNGVPIDGVRAIEVDLWRVATGGATEDLVCRTVVAEAPVVKGRFRIALDSSCVAAVHANSDVWVDVVVGGVSLGRAKVGSVPYALEAEKASGASGPLLQAIVPQGMIAMFDGACPNGWAEHVGLRGRFPRGATDGDPASLETGGSDDEVLVAHSHHVTATTTTNGSHAHTGTTSTDGSHSHGENAYGYTTGINQSGVAYAADRDKSKPYDLGTTDPAGSHYHTFTTAAEGTHSHSVDGETTTIGTEGAGKNVPAYKEVIFCVKQ